MKHIAEDVKEFFNVRNTQDDAYFTELPRKFRDKLVEKLVAHVEGKAAVRVLCLCDGKTFAHPNHLGEVSLSLRRLLTTLSMMHPRLLTCSPS